MDASAETVPQSNPNRFDERPRTGTPISPDVLQAFWDALPNKDDKINVAEALKVGEAIDRMREQLDPRMRWDL